MHRAARHRFLQPGDGCLGTVLAALPTVNEPPGCALSDTPHVRITGIRLDRLVLPLDPPFPAAWDPVPRRSFAATIVRVETDEGVVGIGSGDTMDGFEAFEHLFIGGDPLAIARHVRVARDDRLPRRPLLAARGRPVGHRRPGRRAAGRDAVRRRERGHPGLCLVRDAAGTGRPRRIGAAPARRGVRRAQDPDRSAPARGGARRGRGDPRRRRRLDGDHGRPQPGLADGRRHDAARSIRSPPARSPSASPTSASCGSRSRWPAPTCAAWPRCGRRRRASASPAAR